MSYRFSWALHSQISHKLRTPLTYLTMPLKYLKDDYSTISEKERVEFINSAYDGAIRLQSAIEDIFQYLAAVSSEYPSQNICELNRISSIIDNLKTNLQLETVDVLFIDTEDIFIPLPEESLVMVLGELLENAKKFHPQEKPLINVTVSQIANNIQIAVADDGHNLPEEQLTKIWEPYYQVDKYFTGEIVGMGLGLPTVASLIWGVGGSCVAKNRPDKAGLIVELVLPIKS